jgi:hypothetical protein
MLLASNFPKTTDAKCGARLVRDRPRAGGALIWHVYNEVCCSAPGLIRRLPQAV